MPGTSQNIAGALSHFTLTKIYRAFIDLTLQMRQIPAKCVLLCMQQPQKGFPKHCTHCRFTTILTFTIKVQRIRTASLKQLTLLSNLAFCKLQIYI